LHWHYATLMQVRGRYRCLWSRPCRQVMLSSLCSLTLKVLALSLWVTQTLRIQQRIDMTRATYHPSQTQQSIRRKRPIYAKMSVCLTNQHPRNDSDCGFDSLDFGNDRQLLVRSAIQGKRLDP